MAGDALHIESCSDFTSEISSWAATGRRTETLPWLIPFNLRKSKTITFYNKGYVQQESKSLIYIHKWSFALIIIMKLENLIIKEKYPVLNSPLHPQFK